MRMFIVVTSALLTGPSLADSVRHLSVPERFWGTWAPNADLCRDKAAIIAVSSKGYETSQETCAVQWVTETAGRSGPIYSAHLRCTMAATPDQKTELNRIIIPHESGQLSAGPDFDDLKTYARCPAN